jgi:hypothetical protein
MLQRSDAGKSLVRDNVDRAELPEMNVESGHPSPRPMHWKHRGTEATAAGKGSPDFSPCLAIHMLCSSRKSLCDVVP